MASRKRTHLEACAFRLANRRSGMSVIALTNPGTDIRAGLLTEKRIASAAQRLGALREYGGFALAYSAAFQPGLDYFAGEQGFIAYKQVGSTAFALSDPVAPITHHEALIRRFVELKKDVCFWQASRPVAKILETIGFYVNEMGTETRLDLNGYDFTGPRKRNFRTALKRATGRGDTIAERTVASLDAAELRTLSERWRQTRGVKNREMTFLTRPAVLDDEVDVRKFFSFGPDGNLQALAFFDPIYDGGKVVGYLSSAKRRLPEADDLTCYALLHRAIRTFQDEGTSILSLGLSPLSGIGDDKLAPNRLLNSALRTVYNSRLFNKLVYPLQGFAAHKGAFGGATRQTYCALRKGFALAQLIKMPRACNVI
jgi:lysylphosphatidylglycerol synthetase-like protein (DUF2156 family)